MKRSFADIMAGLDGERAQKVARKLPEWAAVDAARRAAGLDPLEFPSTLSLEQCSSSATARYKAHLAGQAAAAANLRFAHPSHAFRRGPLPFTRPWVATGLPAAPPDPAEEEEKIGVVLDLTGGLGVDSWALSRVAERVVYFERNEELAAAAGRNFQRLGAGNIELRCETVTPQTELPEADLIYADPARRDAAGRKVFLLEDCTPDILTLLPMLLRKAPAVLLKLSPMADLAMLAERLGSALHEIHVVECDGEVKEILCLLLHDNPSPEPDIIVARLFGQAAAVAKLRASRYPSQAGAWAPPVHEATGGHGFATVPPVPAEKAANADRPDDSNMVSGAVAASVPPMAASVPPRGAGVPPMAADDMQMGADAADGDVLRFRMSEERSAEAVYAVGVQPGDVLLEPCPALLKAGAFRLPCRRWGLRKLAPSTHLYLLPGAEMASSAPGNPFFLSPGAETASTAPGSRFFKAWRIAEVLPFGAAAFKDLKRRYPCADVTARNLPIGSAELQKRLGVASGGKVHIFGCRLADGTSVLLVTEPV